MVSALISRLVILLFGTLYPAYASYKAVRTKNVKEYVKWMMYWIIFALFTCVETFSDMFIAWIPFYYEIKIVFVLWLLSPVTKGSSFLYRKFVHPQFSKREKEIDDYIAKASDKGYTTLISLGSKGITYATNVVLQTAIKGQSKLADQIRKSYSMSDIASSASGDAIQIIDASPENSEDELDNRIAEDNRELERKRDQLKRRKKIQRSSSSAGALYSLSEEESETSLTKETSTRHRTKHHHEPRYSTRSTYSTSEALQLHIGTSVRTSYVSQSYTSTSRLYSSSSAGSLSYLSYSPSSSPYTPVHCSGRLTGRGYYSASYQPALYSSKSFTSLSSYSTLSPSLRRRKTSWK